MKKLKSLVAIFVSTIIFFVIADFFSGAYFVKFYDQIREQKYRHLLDERAGFDRGYREQHPIFHHTLKSNYESFDLRYEKICTDFSGFKTDCKNMHTDQKNFDIAFIGDSFTEGVRLPYEKTFVGLIANALPQKKIANLGVASYSPSIYLTKVKYFLDRGYFFKEVVVYIDISDTEDEARYYDLINGVVHDKPSPLIQKKIEGKEDSRPTGTIFFAKYFPLSHRLMHEVKYFLVNLGKRPVNFYPNNRAAWTYNLSVDGYGPSGARGAIELEKKYMGELYALLKSRNIKLSVGVYPWPDQLAMDKEDSIQVQIWQDFCKSRCSNFFNAFKPFHTLLNKKGLYDVIDEYYLPGDIHFNEAGNEVIANNFLEIYKK